MTGVLVVQKITPVIKALFSAFELNENPIKEGEYYIAKLEEAYISWDTILGYLLELANDLGLEINAGDEIIPPDCEEVLDALGTHFNAIDQPDFNHLLESGEFEDEADLNTLFTIAQALDDGHGLKAYKVQSAWHGDKPQVGMFGGSGEYRGVHFCAYGDSTEVIDFGENVNTALQASDVSSASEHITNKVTDILNGITDESVRLQVRNTLLQNLVSM